MSPAGKTQDEDLHMRTLSFFSDDMAFARRWGLRAKMWHFSEGALAISTVQDDSSAAHGPAASVSGSLLPGCCGPSGHPVRMASYRSRTLTLGRVPFLRFVPLSSLPDGPRQPSGGRSAYGVDIKNLMSKFQRLSQAFAGRDLLPRWNHRGICAYSCAYFLSHHTHIRCIIWQIRTRMYNDPRGAACGVALYSAARTRRVVGSPGVFPFSG